MVRKSRMGVRLRGEQLENRLLLDGNVSATLSGSTLRMRGDDAANMIAIMPSGTESGVIEVLGLNTQVNGQDTPGEFRGVKSIVVELRGGDDQVALGEITGTADPLSIARDVTIKGDSGNDSILVTGANISGKLTINGGNGSDQIGVGTIPASQLPPEAPVVTSPVRVRRDVNIDTGSGADVVAVVGLTSDNLKITGKSIAAVGVIDSQVDDLSITTGSGNNAVAVESVIADEVRINTGSGDDTLVDIGQDQLELSANPPSNRYFGDQPFGLIAKSLRLDTGSGNDLANLAASIIARDAVFQLGSGNDYLGVTGTGTDSELAPLLPNFGRDVRIYGGSGDDRIVVTQANIADDLWVYGDGGNDVRIELTSNRVGDDVWVYGGSGNDGLTISGNVVLDDMTIFAGSGDDTLALTANAVRDRLYAYGGSGSDLINADYDAPGINSARKLKAFSFNRAPVSDNGNGGGEELA